MSSRVSTNSYTAFDNRVGITLRVNGQSSRNAGSGGETWVVFFSETGVGAMLSPISAILFWAHCGVPSDDIRSRALRFCPSLTCGNCPTYAHRGQEVGKKIRKMKRKSR